MTTRVTDLVTATRRAERKSRTVVPLEPIATSPTQRSLTTFFTVDQAMTRYGDPHINFCNLTAYIYDVFLSWAPPMFDLRLTSLVDLLRSNPTYVNRQGPPSFVLGHLL